jgi:hypothetical protein
MRKDYSRELNADADPAELMAHGVSLRRSFAQMKAIRRILSFLNCPPWKMPL